MAVVPAERGTGVGRALVVSALRRCRAEGWHRMVVATAAADVGNLRFYQRLGFRMLAVERDAFTPATGYPDPTADRRHRAEGTGSGWTGGVSQLGVTAVRTATGGRGR